MSRATWLCPNRTEAYRVTKAAMPFTLLVSMPFGSFRTPPARRTGTFLSVGSSLISLAHSRVNQEQAAGRPSRRSEGTGYVWT